MTTLPDSLDFLSASERMALRLTLAERQNHRCCWCGELMHGEGDDPSTPTYEHVVPRSKGGSNKLANIVIACLGCNQTRDSMDECAFRAWIDACRSPHSVTPPAWVDGVRGHFIAWYNEVCIRPGFTPIDANIGHLQAERVRDGLAPLDPIAWIMFYHEHYHNDRNHSGKRWTGPIDDPFEHPRRLWPELALELASEQQGHRCCFCARPFTPQQPGLSLPCDKADQEAKRYPEAIVVACRHCMSEGGGMGALGYYGYLKFRCGGTEPQDIIETENLVQWLRTTFNSRTVRRIHDEYKEVLNDARADGVVAKSWRHFLSDLKSACEEYGIAA